MRREVGVSRRGFVKGFAAGFVGLPYFVGGAVLGKGGTAASERITVGAIGVGAQGTHDLKGFLQLSDARVVAVCDVSGRALERGAGLVNGKYGNSDCTRYDDFREMLARDDIDAVSIVTPVHWHSVMAMAAARAGKDIFMEKPVSLSVAESRAVREAVGRYGNVFQLGTQQRSGRNFRFACELALNGRLGKVHTINVGTAYGKVSENIAAMAVPDWLDYERWLGPAPWSPFNDKKLIRDWHENISDYSLGMIHCWGIHHLDIAQWGADTQDTGPVEVEGTGVFPGDGTCDCMLAWDVKMKFANGVTISFTDGRKNAHGVRFEGDKGWVFVNRQRLQAEPASLLKEQIAPGERHLPVSTNHLQDFLDAVRSRQEPISPIGSAVRSDTVCHLSYIAAQLGRKLKWDPEAERFIGDDQANRMLLPRPMRSPWHL
ncbi:MAG: Gfo/Idh/MocA family protein [Planctomycetota bacterium]|jgi:predicted dehydrogenase